MRAIVKLTELRGLPCSLIAGGKLPDDPKWCREALKQQNLPLENLVGRGGSAQAIRVDHLPTDTQAALIQREMGLPAGEADSALWSAFTAKKKPIRDETQRKFNAVRAVKQMVADGCTCSAAIENAASEFSYSVATLERALATVRDLPEANWLPALAPNYKGGGKVAHIDEEAWSMFLGLVKAHSARHPLKESWREVRRVAVAFKWAWPSFDTVLRKWNRLGPSERAYIRSGAKALDDSIPTQTRTVAHMQAMQWVNIDGRQVDFFARWEDGTVSRPILIAIQDVFSRKCLAWRMCKTESAADALAVVLDVIDRYGLFDEILSDNGRAFASKKLTGGTEKRFRWTKGGDEVEGVLTLLGIKCHFAIPKKGRSKPIERMFLEHAEKIDARYEFKGAHCGHKPDAKPEEFDGTPVDIEVARAVYARQVELLNDEKCRRTEMCKGKISYREAFEASYISRPRRDLLPAQRVLFSYERVLLKPNPKTSELRSKGFVYFSPAAQPILAQHNQVILCTNPNDRSQPAFVLDRKHAVIVEELPCIERGQFDNADHANQHNRGRNQLMAAKRKRAKALNIMVAAKVADIQQRAAGSTAGHAPVSKPTSNVSAPAFKAPRMKPAPAPRTDEADEQAQENESRLFELVREKKRQSA